MQRTQREVRAIEAVEQIVVYGAGAQAREIAWMADALTDAGSPTRVVAFVDDDPATHGRIVNDVPVAGLIDARASFPEARMIVGVGSSAARETMSARARDAGFAFASLVHPRVERSRWVAIGEGTIVGAGSILSTNLAIGRHVQINLACSISHDAIIDDFATISPGVRIAGWVHVERGAFLGIGATVSNGESGAPIVIGAGAVVGAGACVLRSVEPGATVAGVPARAIGTR